MRIPARGLLALLFLLASLASADEPPLVDSRVARALAHEISGEVAKRNLEFLSRQHRMRGSRGFRAAADHIAAELRSYGLEASLEQFPADGKIFYGTQKSRRPWDAEFAELWELPAEGPAENARRIASWEAMPLTLAQDSESGEVTAELVDVGSGTSEKDYAGKTVSGKLVLASAQPGPVARLAVEKYGASGIVSYAQNQRTAWWGENENLVRWGHLDTFAAKPAFAFMISLKEARNFQQRLGNGQSIRLHAIVRAGQHDGTLDVLTATIPGADPRLGREEILFSCHLDHPRPGANDNASGAAAILEIARTLSKLIREGKLPPPARTIRFVWPPEIEGTVTLLNARPDIARRAKAAIHLDMVGGGPETKAIFHVTRGPASLPSFINDVAEAFGMFVNAETAAFAKGARAGYPLNAVEGGKEALGAEMAPFSQGSDHQVYTDSSFGIPAIYLNDWPDRYIHTNFDTPANIDPTKLKRAAFIAAASGWFLANVSAADASRILEVLQQNALREAAEMLERRRGLSGDDAANLTRHYLGQQRMLVESMSRFFEIPPGVRSEASAFLTRLGEVTGSPREARKPAAAVRIVYRRNPKLKGPLSVFGYDYFTDHYGAERETSIRLLKHQGARGSGADYAYEALNFVDGKRTIEEIRDALSAEYGPVPVEVVGEYLAALEEIRVVENVLAK